TQLKAPVGTNSSLTAQRGYSPGIQAWYNLYVEPDPTLTDSANKHPQRLVFGLEEIWENNLLLNGPSSATTLERPWETQPVGAWHVIGRYWNACGSVR